MHYVADGKQKFSAECAAGMEERNARIDRRLDERLENGMVEEVKGLLDSGIRAEDRVYYGLE